MTKIKLQPLQDRVLIKEDTSNAERKTSSGIIIPVTTSDDKGFKKGEIVAVGPGRMEDGKLIPCSLKVGQTVIFQWADKIRMGEDEYFVVREGEIMAVIK